MKIYTICWAKMDIKTLKNLIAYAMNKINSKYNFVFFSGGQFKNNEINFIKELNILPEKIINIKEMILF